MRILKFVFAIILLMSLFLLSFSIDTYSYDDETIEVEVKGNLKNEGIFKLDKGSTFNELLPLINLNDDSDISYISLFDALYNKQVIVIGTKDNNNNRISINTATKELLITLPGIGDKTAEAIINYRKVNGSFKTIEEIMNIKGIGIKKFEKIKDRITL